MNKNSSDDDFYDYERWPSDLLSWWRELRARVPDNMTTQGEDFDVVDEFAPGYIEGAELEHGGISEHEARALRIANILRLYYTPAVSISGLLFSLLALPVLFRVSKATRSSHLPYIIGITVCTVLYLIGLILIWLGSIGVNVYGVPGTCQFTAFISQASHFLYTWIIVALVTDRLAVQMLALKTCPAWLALMISQSRAKILILFLTALALAVFFNLSMMEGTVHFGAVKICVVIVEYLKTSLVLDRIDAILNFFIPFLIIIIIDIALILNHCRLKLKRVPLAISDTFPIDPLRPSPSPSTESSTPEPSGPQQTTMGRVTPSVSSIIATVVTSGLFVVLSMPVTIQRTVSTFADDHLLFTMTAKGILYQHTFANIFYTVFVLNIIFTFSIDADIRRETGHYLRNSYRTCLQRASCTGCKSDEPDTESGSDSNCGKNKTGTGISKEPCGSEQNRNETQL